MRVKKWGILLFYVYLLFSFGYLSYVEFMGGRGFMWVIWLMATLGIGYQIFTFLKKKNGDGWNRSYVVADDRIFRRILVSLSLAYVVALIILLVGTVGLSNGTISGHPLHFMTGAIIFSLFVFMLSQIVQGIRG